mgnify:CR=1 FL=1
MSEIAKYKKQHPEYRNIPDIELAEILYEKAYKGRMNESEFYEFAFPEIAAKRGTDEIISPDDEFNENFEFKSDKPEFKPTTSEVAKSAGVSVNDPADIKSRFGGSLGYKKYTNKTLMLERDLKQES